MQRTHEIITRLVRLVVETGSLTGTSILVIREKYYLLKFLPCYSHNSNSRCNLVPRSTGAELSRLCSTNSGEIILELVASTFQ